MNLPRPWARTRILVPSTILEPGALALLKECIHLPMNWSDKTNADEGNRHRG